MSPFNYASGKAKGLELSGTYSDSTWLAYLNLAYQKAQGKNIISGQSLLGANELAYIANHYIYLDHDQTYTASGGVTYKFAGNGLGADVLYGSGLRKTSAGGPPNGAHLPAYAVVNSSITHLWKTSPNSSIEGRLALLNVFDKTSAHRNTGCVAVSTFR